MEEKHDELESPLISNKRRELEFENEQDQINSSDDEDLKNWG